MNRWHPGVPLSRARQEGKGAVGCFLTIVFLSAGLLFAVRVGPPYVAYKSFETEVTTIISRAGANFYDDERLVSSLLAAAKKNEVPLEREHIKLERYSNQLQAEINYVVPISLIVYNYDMNCSIKAQSFVGRF